MASLGSFLGSFLGGGGSLVVSLVEQLSLNSVRVAFSSPPVVFNKNATTDGLNPANYFLAQPAPLTQSVVSDGANSSSVTVFFDAELPAGALLSLTVQNVSDGSTVVPTTTLPIVPFGAERRPGPVGQALGRFDIANPQTPQDSGPGRALGVFQLDESGDLANDTGRANLRKRIFRRLSTRPGGFFHLPNYGLNLEDKTLITPTQLRRIQIDTQDQILEEPDVVAASVRVSQLAPGVVRLRLIVTDRFGTFNMDVTPGTEDA